VKDRPLTDGNKRLGWLATAVILELTAAPVTEATNDDVYDLVVPVAAGKNTVEHIATAMRDIVCRGRSTEVSETDRPWADAQSCVVPRRAPRRRSNALHPMGGRPR
jgi:hypothetical protein